MKTNLLAMVLAVVVMSGSAFAATVSAISPTTGPSSGGQKVRIYGTGFNTTANTSVTIGGVAVQSSVVNAAGTAVDCVTGSPGPTGAGDVVVTDTAAAGNSATGVGLYTYISRNSKLVVQISATVANRAQIQWGAGTTLDDTTPTAIDHTQAPDRITNYAWTVKDSAIGIVNLKQQIDLGTNYRSDDFQNGKTINVSNVSAIAGTTCTISAIATGGAPYSLAGSTGALDTIAVKALMGNGAMLPLNGAQTLTNSLAVGVDQPLVIEFDSPTSISPANVGQTAVTTVTLTATGN